VSAHADFDRQFIDLLVAHHRESISMLELAGGRAEHRELQSFALDGISARKNDLENLKDWRARWYGQGESPPNAGAVTLPDMPEHVVVATGAEMERLKSARPFDRALIELLLPHHQRAIDAAKVASLRATHAEIKALATRIVERHEREVETLKRFYTKWYGSGRK
jgi:uncharacterized protein (DUF305 family)